MTRLRDSVTATLPLDLSHYFAVRATSSRQTFLLRLDVERMRREREIEQANEDIERRMRP